MPVLVDAQFLQSQHVRLDHDLLRKTGQLLSLLFHIPCGCLGLQGEVIAAPLDFSLVHSAEENEFLAQLNVLFFELLHPFASPKERDALLRVLRLVGLRWRLQRLAAGLDPKDPSWWCRRP